MSWLHPEEIGTLGASARSRASTQRARARRDQVGKNWRESARAWEKLVIFMVRVGSGRDASLSAHHPGIAAIYLSLAG